MVVSLNWCRIVEILLHQWLEMVHGKNFWLAFYYSQICLYVVGEENNYDIYKSSNELLEKLNNLLNSNTEIKIENYNNLNAKFVNFLKNI